MFFGKNNRELFLKQYNHLSAALIQDLLKERPGENVIISPFSILMLLTIAAESTAGETKEQITDYLCGKMDYESFLNEILSSGNAISGKQFRSANAVCVNSKLRDSVSADYIDRVNSVLHGKFFSSGNMSRDVNEWVKEMTGGKIDRITDNSLDDMLLCLLNAVTFDADWRVPFDKDYLVDRFFTSFDGTVRTCRMMKSCEYSYLEGRDFTGFKKDYKNGIFSFIALLPWKEGKQNLFNLLTDLNISEIYKTTRRETVFTSLPKFKFEYNTDLKAYFNNSGIQKLFLLHADFSPLSSEELMADSIMHKAYITVNERGTRAGAVTAKLACAGASPKEFYSVNLDRPFIFAVIHHETTLPIFVGVVNYIDKNAIKIISRGSKK